MSLQRDACSLDRRTFVGLSASVAAGLGFAGIAAAPRHANAAGLSPSSSSARKATNVIFMVSDGMSFGTLTLAELWSRVRGGGGTNWVSLFNRGEVRRALQMTHSADSLVTDSAAAGSAWGSGRHINNGAINVSPSGEQLLPLLIHAKQHGKATGLVTTTTVTHATPASFATNAPTREMQPMIGEQLLARGIDVVMGGGSRYLPAELLAKHQDLTVLRDATDLRAALPGLGTSPNRLIGLFADKHIPFEIDRPPNCPTLAEMTKAALARLSGRGEGFVLQVEGGRVDHAAHSNDAASLVREQTAFDDALGEVMAFVDGRDDTLVVVTTDHGNANPGLTLYGPRGEAGLKQMLGAKRSFEWIVEQITALRYPKAPEDRIATVVEDAMGVELDAAARAMLLGVTRGQRVMPFGGANTFESVLGAILADSFGVGFVSPNHTADLTEVTAWGPGAERLGAIVDNVDLHRLLVESLALGPGKLLPGMEDRMEVRAPKSDD